MRTTLTLLLTLTGCMADWTAPVMISVATDGAPGKDSAGGPDVAKGADALQGQDSKGNDTGMGAPDSQGADTSAKPVCDMPTKDRLVQNISFDGNMTWHDKLLDIDCVFYPTDGFGKRCMPIHWNKGLLIGVETFPNTNDLGVFMSADCKSEKLFACKPDVAGKYGRFGFVKDNDTSNKITAAYNLVDPPAANVVQELGNTGKAEIISGVYSGQPSKCVSFPMNYPHKDHAGIGGYAIRVAGKVASIPECPFLTGLNLFAAMP